MNRRGPAIFSATVVAILFIVSAWAWTQLPADAQVPIHWDADGTPNGFASKTVGLLLLPLITAGVAALFWIIPTIEPRRANILKSEKAYIAIWVALVLLLAAIDLVAVAAALGSEVNVSSVVPIGVGALFVVIGNYLPKVRPNYMVGIRTPWTLTSDLAWDRTHRLGGRLFVVEGVVFILFGLLRPPREALIVGLLGGIAVILVVLFAYSYRVWRIDPAKRVG